MKNIFYNFLKSILKNNFLKLKYDIPKYRNLWE